MTSVALPRVRARRRKIKPPGPSFWWALAFVVWDIAFGMFDFAVIARNGRSAGLVIGLGCGAIMVTALILVDWPRFRRELDKWKADQ